MKLISKTKSLFLMFSFLNFLGCGSSNYAPLPTVEKVDLERYIGKWYEIARLPNSFQEDCYNSTAEYSFDEDGDINVINSCNEDSPDGEIDVAEGTAWAVEGSNNSRLKVQFQWPFKGDYYIIALDDDYKYAMVGSPSRKYLWILNREPSMDESTFNELVQIANEKGFDTSKLIIEEGNVK